ncbi:hypothetical protein HanXRQr2_Chr17g0805891 [Helianthus annuus]|uniref:Uncharacterized protein n=1 Tax=Helianthus annuus TaxID=4232 RepID=A0A251RRJ2_HELAN|nr:hypothetical protein HanXRQr2_Chr17g0805891 [Helianthus annuus]
MIDQWAPDSKDVPILKLGDQEVQLYQATFATFGGVIGSRPLKAGEQYWYDQIKGYFMYPVADVFTDPPTSTEGVLRDLGIDPEDKKKKPMRKKKVQALDPEVTSKGVGSSRATTSAADKGEKKHGAGGSKSSGSAGSCNPDAGTTPSSAAHEEGDEEEVEEEPAVKLIRKRSREAALGASVLSKPGGVPTIGKKATCALFTGFLLATKKTPEKKSVVFMEPSEPALKKPKITVKPFKTSVIGSEKDKQAAEGEKEKTAEKERRAEEEKRKAEDEKRKAERRKRKLRKKKGGRLKKRRRKLRMRREKWGLVNLLVMQRKSLGPCILRGSISLIMRKGQTQSLR